MPNPESTTPECPSDGNRNLYPKPNNPADYGGHGDIPVNNSDTEEFPDPLQRLRKIRKEQGLDTPGISDKYNSEGRSPKGVVKQRGSDNNLFNSLEP